MKILLGVLFGLVEDWIEVFIAKNVCGIGILFLLLLIRKIILNKWIDKDSCLFFYFNRYSIFIVYVYKCIYENEIDSR